jgi:hypothetical protein
MQADPLFAEQVRDAENECEMHLMSRIRLQSERSWRAAVWLLERMRPERYARGKAQQSAPNWDEMFDKSLALIDAEVADEALRERLTRRLDEMALEELAAQELDDQPVLADVADQPAPHAEPAHIQANVSESSNCESTGDNRLKQSPAAASDKVVEAFSALLAAQQASRAKELLAAGKPLNRKQRRALEFCNTSHDVHEQRALDNAGG